MDPVSSVTRWFKMLFMSRVHGAQASVKGKIYGAQARVKGKVAGGFNKRVDGAVKGVKGKAMKGAKGIKGAKPGSALKKPGRRPAGAGSVPAKQEAKMGWFGRKNRNTEADVGQESFEPAPEEATVAISVGDMGLALSEECVGWVVALNGPLKGKDYRLTPGKNIMGTTADCDVVLTDPYLSSKHCGIRYEDGSFTLIDLDSTNGTYLNGRRMAKSALVDNDTIRVGRTDLKFKALE